MAADKTVESLDAARNAGSAMDEKKALNRVLLDVRGISQVTDFILVATGTSAPHVKALSDEVQRALKKNLGRGCFRKAGTAEGGWIVLDYLDVVIHVFSAEAREYYAIEELSVGAPRMALR